MNPFTRTHKAGNHAFRRFRNAYLRNYTECPAGLYKYWMGHTGEDISDLYDKIKEDVAFRRRFPRFDFSLNMVYGLEVIRDLPTGVHMGATTKLTYEDYEKLPEREGIIYELDEGELLMEPSPALRHNLIRQRIAMELTQFIRHHHLGAVVEEMDFRLGLDTVRNPDVAFITADHLKNIDPDLSPVEGAPALAVEVISPSNFAQDTVKKVRQYLAAGCRAVWLIYPSLRLVEIHDAAGVRSLTEQESLDEDKPFDGHKFSLSLAVLFETDLQK